MEMTSIEVIEMIEDIEVFWENVDKWSDKYRSEMLVRFAKSDVQTLLKRIKELEGEVKNG